MADATRLDEASIIHRALFGADAPEELRKLYADALAAATLSDWPRVEVHQLVAGGVDLEALELALRLRQPRNALTQRFQTMAYLAEARPDHFAHFVNERRGWWNAWMSLTGHVVRSACKLVKGRWLIRVHDIG